MTETFNPAATAEALYCVNHPKVETRLRCNKCSRPICTRCALLTPVGYRCRECVHGQQKVFLTAVWYDYVVAIVLAGVLSGIAGTVLISLGVWLFSFFLSPIAGTLIASAVQLATRRRRGRYLVESAAGAMVLGMLPSGIAFVLFGEWFSLLYLALYLVLAVGTFVARLRGIMIR